MNFLTFNLLTIASFRIGVPLIIQEDFKENDDTTARLTADPAHNKASVLDGSLVNLLMGLLTNNKARYRQIDAKYHQMAF